MPIYLFLSANVYRFRFKNDLFFKPICMYVLHWKIEIWGKGTGTDMRSTLVQEWVRYKVMEG